MESSFIYNPEGSSGHSHAASIAEHGDKVFCAWYMYPEKEHISGSVCLAQFDSEKSKWTKGRDCFPIFAGASLGNPVIFSAGGKLHMYFVKLNTYWHDAQIYYTYLENENLNSWSNPLQVNVELGYMVRHRPLVTAGGDLIIPAYDERTMETVVFKATTDYTKWTEISKVAGDFIQGDIIATGDREMQMFLRAAKDNTHVYRTLSANGGASWSTPTQTSLPCPMSGIAAIGLSDGNIVVCNNHTEEHKRNPISYSVSTNSGVTFEFGPWDLDSNDIELSYPTMLKDKNNNIHLVFTFNRKMLKSIIVTESELMEKMKEFCHSKTSNNTPPISTVTTPAPQKNVNNDVEQEKTIADFKDLHRSKRCFIVASGPSIKNLDLSPLSRRINIGLNRSFMAFPGSYYHCVFDHRLFDLYPKELAQSRFLFTLEDRPFGVPVELLGANGFSWDLTKGIYSGYTISYFALQLAVYMGMKEIFFLGLDLKNDRGETHFFGTDYNSQNHDNTEYPKMLKSFADIAPLLKEKGIKVYNCSEHSSLKCFDYMSYDEAIKL